MIYNDINKESIDKLMDIFYDKIKAGFFGQKFRAGSANEIRLLLYSYIYHYNRMRTVLSGLITMPE